MMTNFDLNFSNWSFKIVLVLFYNHRMLTCEKINQKIMNIAGFNPFLAISFISYY